MSLSQSLHSQNATSAEASKVCVVQFDKSGQRDSHIFDRSTNLRSYLNQNTRTHRRIFIVEDLARNFVELLGSRLKIHPLVFARHLADLSFLESFDELFPDEPELTHFTLPFFHFMDAPAVVQSTKMGLEEIYRTDANVRRLFALPKSFGTFDHRATVLELECCISYWNQRNPDGGWDGE
jgi:hypothetical protein